MSLQQQFDSFLENLHPIPPAPGTHRHSELQEAFFAGALVATESAEDISDELNRHYAEEDSCSPSR